MAEKDLIVTMRQFFPYIGICIMLVLFTGVMSRAGEDSGRGPVVVISLDGSINPATHEYINSGIRNARAKNA